MAEGGLSTGAAETLTGAQAAMLQAWLSPAFPIGAFAWSHGLEQAVEAGQVDGPEALRAWLEALLRHGAGRSDAVLLAAAWRDPDDAGPEALAAALQPSAERRAETLALGAAFARAVSAGWGVATAAAAYPVAVGRAARAAGLPLAPLTRLFLQGFAANLVSAGQRLIPIGETDGQRVLAALLPVCEAVAAKALEADPEDVGGACLAADLASMLHETQSTRLFRS
ncbi:MAG: urease accessory UreF family protein [Pseudomonadota bacterium]